MTDIEAPSPDPDPKLRNTLSRAFSKGGGNSIVVGEDEAMLKAKTTMFKLLRQNDPKEVSRNLRNLLSSMADEHNKSELCKKTDEVGNTAFHVAAKAGNLEACKLLLESGAELNRKNHDKMNPLQFAARYGDRAQQDEVWKCMEWMINENKKKVAHKPSIRTGSFSSIQRGTFKDKQEKAKEDDWKEKDRYGFTLLHLAIQNINWTDKTTVVEGLTRLRDFRVTDTDKRGNNCLHLAAQLEGGTENKALYTFLRMKDNHIIKKCLQAENIQGETPLACASKVGNADSVKQLLEAVKDLRSFDYQHPLCTSAR